MTTTVDHLPDLLSLDLTAGLVARGLRAYWSRGETAASTPVYTLDVLDASNTSPIVITVAAGSLGVLNPREGRVLHVVIADVEGNTAANKQDPKSLRNEAWIGIITSPTTIALYDLDNSTGGLIASTGNGAYAGGGTVSKALRDGRILTGIEYVGEESFAPKIVMVPLKTAYSPRDVRTSFSPLAFVDGEPDRVRTLRSLWTVTWWYDVHVWGAVEPNVADPVKRSFGVVEQLHHQVIRSAYARCKGVIELGGGTWLDQVEGAPQRIKGGHELIFQLGLSAPIPEDEIEFAPADTTVDAVLSIQVTGGEPEEV